MGTAEEDKNERSRGVLGLELLTGRSLCQTSTLLFVLGLDRGA